MIRNRIKIQQVEVTLATTNTAGERDVAFQVDTSFSKITGMRILEITDGDQGSEYNVGLRSKDGNIIDPVNKTTFESSSAVAPDAKFLKLDADIEDGMNLRVVYQTVGTIATDALNFYVQLRLEGDNRDN